MNPPTEEKTMEWELEFDFDIKDYIEVFSRQEKVGYIFDLPKFRRFIKSLLASSQDSFRRKVEEMEGYVQHDRDCILSQWSAGRNTKDGGYEMKFNG